MPLAKPFRLAAAVLAAVGLLPLQSQAQTARTATEEYADVVKGAQTITALGPDLFGEAVNLKDGNTSFSATDVSIPTNSGLPLSIGRSFGVNSRDADRYVDPVADGELFGNWRLEVPTISGTYDERIGWVSSSATSPQSRCSNVGAPPSVKSVYTPWNIYYYSEDYWRGNTIRIPGKGTEMMLGLLAGRTLPSDGKTYRWTTKDNWIISCIPLKNGAGEGFLVTLPDGTRYSFDWMSSRRAAALKDTHCENIILGYEVRGVNVGQIMPDDLERLHRVDGGSISGGEPATICNEQIVVNRREYFLHATRVEDRHGNSIVYNYDPSIPRRLTSVVSNDDATISLTYNAGGMISTVSTNGREWQYQYETVSTYGTKLVAVVLPDTSRWTFQYGELFSILDYNKKVKWPDCEPFVAGTTVATLTIGHPSGASGAFAFQNMLHGVDRTPGGCYVPNPDRPLKVDLSHHVMAYKVASLLSKQISGPGLATQTWNYTYQSSWSWNLSGYVDDCTVPTQCSSTTTTEVSAPDGTVTRSVFGNDYYRSVGQVQRVEVLSDGNVIQQTAYSYIGTSAGQTFAGRAGWDPLLMNNPFESEQLHPLQATTLVRDGDSYYWQVDTCGSATTYCFDAFARPTRVRKSSSLGWSRTETTEHYDDFDLWVLGQVAKTTVADAGPNGIGGGMIVAENGYDTRALPAWTKRFGQPQQSMTYHADGTLATTTDPRGHVTTTSSWKRGIPQTIRHPATTESPAGAVESATVDDNGWITSVTDEIGAKTCFGYDVMGRIASILHPSETQPGVCDDSDWNPVGLAFERLDTPANGLAAGHWRGSRHEGNLHVDVYYDALWRPAQRHRRHPEPSGQAL